jgi:uncharacterized membrane protein YpjA
MVGQAEMSLATRAALVRVFFTRGIVMAVSLLRALTDNLDRPWMLWSLFVVNLLGSIYGFYWYKDQLSVIGSWLNIFVPDSPTASSAFTLVLFLYALRRRSPLIEAFAAVTLFKYGIWAVAVILLGGIASSKPFLESLHWTDWMLMTSHLGMAIQGILYSRFYTYGRGHLALVGGWTILNDGMDYILDIHPWLPGSIAHLDGPIGVFTLGLSLVSLILFARLGLRPAAERKWQYPSIGL